jgi:hypothetical protein
MSKRLGLFLGLGLFGVVMLLAGLSWDAILHASDPTLAAREGVFAWRNPGHALLGLGIGTVVVSLLGAVDTLLTMTGNPRWARPVVRNGFLAGSTALLVAAGAITSWSAGIGHDDHGAEAAAHGQTPAAHGHEPQPGAEAEAGAGGEPTSVGHSHDLGPVAAAGGAIPGDHHADDAGAALGGETAGVTGHDHGATAAATSPEATPSPAAPATHSHEVPAPAGVPTQAHEAGGAPPERETTPAAGPSTPATPAGRVTLTRYGPFVLPPAGAAGNADHADIFIPEAPRVCSDCFLLGMEPDLVYADGSPANLDTGVMLHHAVLFQSGRVDVTCATSDGFPGRLGERFFASGNERSRGQLPNGFGYPVGNTSWNALFHVMNHSPEPKTVFFSLKARWVPAAQAQGILPVTPIWLDMENCRTSEYDVPAGPSSRHWQWTSTITGRIVSAVGHVHDGGVRTTLVNTTAGQRLCTSWAGYGTKPAYMGGVESMGVCSWDRLGTVRAGEVLDLETAYDSPAPVPRAMGIMMAYVYETPDLGGGTAAPPELTGEGGAPPTSTPPPAGHGGHHVQ